MLVDSNYKIKPALKSRIDTIIVEIFDSSINGFDLSGKTKQGNRGSRNKSDEMNLLNEWKSKHSTLESFDIRSLGTIVNYALFSLYEITKEIKVAESVKPTLAFKYLEMRYKTISVKKEAFVKALTKKENKTLFGKTGDQGYFLTPKGELDIKKLLGIN